MNSTSMSMLRWLLLAHFRFLRIAKGLPPALRGGSPRRRYNGLRSIPRDLARKSLAASRSGAAPIGWVPASGVWAPPRAEEGSNSSVTKLGEGKLDEPGKLSRIEDAARIPGVFEGLHERENRPHFPPH